MSKITQRWVRPSIVRLFGMSFVALLFILTVTPRMADAGRNTSNSNNGEEIAPGEFPWHVSLHFDYEWDDWINPTTEEHSCAGTLIAFDWVLTSASCISREARSTIDIVEYGVSPPGHSLPLPVAVSARGQTSSAVRTIVHGSYQRNVTANIALIQIEPFEFTQYVSPIPLNFFSADQGIEDFEDYLVQNENGDLEQKWTSFGEPSCDDEPFVCSSTSRFCSDDMGGGVIRSDSDRPSLSGIISHYTPISGSCTNATMFHFLDISSYLDWIEEISGVTAPTGTGGTIRHKTFCVELQGVRKIRDGVSLMDQNENADFFVYQGDEINPIYRSGYNTQLRPGSSNEYTTACLDISLPAGSYTLYIKTDDTLAGTTPFSVSRNSPRVTNLPLTLREGDANGDHRVTGADSSILVSSLNAIFPLCEGDVGYQDGADFNEDGCVTGADSSLLVANLNAIVPLASVPLPNEG